MSFLRVLCLIMLLGTGLLRPANAHEVNPAYLELAEGEPGVFEVLWKQPLKDGRRLRLAPVFPSGCESGEKRLKAAGTAVIERWEITCPLTDGEIRIEGLDRTLTDVFVQINRAGEPPISAVLRPTEAVFDLGTSRNAAPLLAYFRIGVEHIIFGFDHLLFVLGLCLVVRPRQLLATITAFTVAHSITLALSTLAGITLPGPPVEAVIALSIILLGREALALQAGREALTGRVPWLIAFGFGLIHGFGFAGALSEIGLPENQEVWALLLFNLGVEAGQLVFVAFIIAIAGGLWMLMQRAQQACRTLAAYFIGVAGTAWLIERVVSFPTV
ncbi:HupE/UreJ family protein [Henriciella sp.]|uniref:HupE/UreJ family protein n=1 Tax=Henriciella sp. TaxID=1968823 RepID=UPI002608BD0F|nr:HupE/UreJ family protein [Henriciella sp.]